jgi:hypothetical protein
VRAFDERGRAAVSGDPRLHRIGDRNCTLG